MFSFVICETPCCVQENHRIEAVFVWSDCQAGFPALQHTIDNFQTEEIGLLKLSISEKGIGV